MRGGPGRRKTRLRTRSVENEVHVDQGTGNTYKEALKTARRVLKGCKIVGLVVIVVKGHEATIDPGADGVPVGLREFLGGIRDEQIPDSLHGQRRASDENRHIPCTFLPSLHTHRSQGAARDGLDLVRRLLCHLDRRRSADF